ncbi:MAG TPA: hypothetical protein VKT99_05895 [Xanthobacteraceae bacterium]|jgi:hypothetical protein|nr:hypothetical protein [Xanthobacteraceae bacterium]
MPRFAVASLMLAGSVLAILGPAQGQGVQYQFTPPPPIKSLPPSSTPSYPFAGALPPVPAPQQSRLAPYRVTPPPGPSDSPSTRGVQTARGRTIFVPTSPRETFGDRVSSCAHAGVAAGLRPNQLTRFMGRCVN